MARGQGGSLFLPCTTLSFATPCRFIPALSRQSVRATSLTSAQAHGERSERRGVLLLSFWRSILVAGSFATTSGRSRAGHKLRACDEGPRHRSKAHRVPHRRGGCCREHAEPRR